MFELTGKYAESCKVFASQVEESAMGQLEWMINHPAFEGAKVRIMPDVHAGTGSVIGFTSTLTDKIIPNIIGVDIGCGVLAAQISFTKSRKEHSLFGPGVKEINFEELDQFIRQNIPFGFGTNDEPQVDVMGYDPVKGERYMYGCYREVKAVTDKIGLSFEKVISSIGSLGGGNHFIEVDRDAKTGEYWVVIHSGSRNFGLQVANYYQKQAFVPEGTHKELGYLEGELAQEYTQAMKVAQNYAKENRQLMMAKLLSYFGVNVTREVESVHNYIDFESGIIRKGAIAAPADRRVIIPWNMKDGIIIGIAKGNEDWNCSAPHGAGRVYSRKKAKQELSLDEFKLEMDGVWSSCISTNTLDESPMAYKDHQEILEQLRDVVKVESTLKPVYNFKA